MARMIPPHPYSDTGSPGEREIFHRFTEEAGSDGWLVLHSLCIADHRRQAAGEADFVVIVPSLGVLCLEVKACRTLRVEDGQWWYGGEQHPDTRGPFRQANEAMHSLREYVNRCDNSLRGIHWGHACVFPYVPLDIRTPEWHPWQVVDSRTFSSTTMHEHVRRIIRASRDHLARTVGVKHLEGTPTAAQCLALANLLRPRYEHYESPADRARRTAGELKHYTHEQFRVLEAMEANPRLVVRGPAGTGKTLLAIESVRRMLEPCGTQGKSSRVLLVCFNKMLGAWLARETGSLSPGLHVGTIHKVMMDVCGIRNIPAGQTSEYWRKALPARALEAVRGGPFTRFDGIVIDEAQDLMSGPFLDFLDACVEGGLARGWWRALGDFERQALYTAEPNEYQESVRRLMTSASLVDLRANCRNTPRIAALVELLGGLDPAYSRVLRPDDGNEPDLRLYQEPDDQRKLLLAALEELRHAGYDEKNIVVLSPLADRKCIAATMDGRSRLVPFREQGALGIRFGSVHAFKGLEAPAIVLTDVEEIGTEAASALFYVGITRAQSRLVILVRQDLRDEILRILSGHRGE